MSDPSSDSALSTPMVCNSRASEPLDWLHLLPTFEPAQIRNFAIIAHIDHGKSTLADRLIERCGELDQRKATEQMLDSMDLERERGITIKSQTVSLTYTDPRGRVYLLNLIDTPGHVDFSFEVSRSLIGCEGALLVVDATQGVQAQTLANCFIASEYGLEIIPVLNKIDMENAQPDRVCQEIEDMIGVDASVAIEMSARTGSGLDTLLAAICNELPPPSGHSNGTLRALVMDSMYNSYLGVILLLRVVDGTLNLGAQVRFLEGGSQHQIEKIWVMTPKMHEVKQLQSGQVGYVAAGIRDIANVIVCDTLTASQAREVDAVTSIRAPKPQVYAGIYPVDSDDYNQLRDGLQKLTLNDSALEYTPESSLAMGFGFRCGFLGTLHMEIVKERLEREYHLNLLITAPSVIYEFHLRNGETRRLSSTHDVPSPQQTESVHEPMCRTRVVVPSPYVGKVIELCIKKRGRQIDMRYHADRVVLVFVMPLAEVILNFHDRIKSCSKGYASVDYEPAGYEKSHIVKLDILINKERCDPLSLLVHRDASVSTGRALASKIKQLIPRQMFEVAIQAQVGSKIIARENVKALRRNVTAKCYGGDITRKRKLLEKQKAGKKRMKQFGRIDIPQEAFLAVLKMGND